MRKQPVDWERWIGIRGAAVLGAVVLALAGILFFQYSIQHGLITPAMRVVLGIATGLACLAASEWLRPRGFRYTPEGLAGAGVVVLYAAFWAGHALFHLIPLVLAFVLMVLVTAVCGLLAVRRLSPLVAVLGLIGGFATPLLLSSGVDRPIGLFGYVLLLDAGVLAVGRRLRWSWLVAIALAGTLLLQALWIVGRMGPDRLPLGLVILGVFAALFAATGFTADPEDRPRWQAIQAGGLLLPFVFAVYLAARADLGPHLWPVAVLLVLLDLGASWTARRIAVPPLAPAAAAASVGVLGVWVFRTAYSSGMGWETAAIAAAVAGVFHAFTETGARSEPAPGTRRAALVAAVGGMAALVIGSTAEGPPPWPWLCGWLVLGVLLCRQAGAPGYRAAQVAATVGPGAGLALAFLVSGSDPSSPAPATMLAVFVTVGAAAQVVPLVRAPGDARRTAEHAAALLATMLAASVIPATLLVPMPAGLVLGAPLLLAVLALLCAARLPEGAWAWPVLLAAAGAHALFANAKLGPEQASVASEVLLAGFAGTALFLGWPFLAGPAYRASRLGWSAAALAGALWFFPMRRAWPLVFGDGAIGMLPVILGALTLAAALSVRRIALADEAPRRGAIAVLAGVAICFASVAIPLQLDKSWVTIGWALEGLGLIALWRRLDHPGLKWFGLVHLAAACARLVPTEALLGSYPRSASPILNWVLYTYLVPAAALFASARILAPLEVARARERERPAYEGGHAVGAAAASVAGILVVFVWINLAIADWFARGPRLTLSFGDSPGRNLAVSIAWALYALVLLGFGMIRSSGGLRWLSLGFLIVTIGKVFLYDLGALRDLYRVMSLVGLAVSLLLVSLLYQRFVFRRGGGGAT